MSCQNEKSIKCPDLFGCPDGICPDFELKRHDTRPGFTITVSDCDGPLDLEDTIVEVSMWAKGKLKKSITTSDTYFSLANNIGFEQSFVGDIIVMNRSRSPEQMLVIGHDEKNKLINVQRGYNGSPISAYSRGDSLRIFRILNGVGETNMVYEDIEGIDGTITNTLIESQLIYNWSADDTCLPGCYWFEFKLLKMITAGMWYLNASAIIPTFTSVTPTTGGCGLGSGVEWARRFPNNEGFLIHISDTPTSEVLA